MKIKLQRVQYMPKDLQPEVLYVSEQFGAAAHLCACGCGSKVRTPLGPTEWSVEETDDGPTLRPSVGSWQQACQSHYLITCGEVRWSAHWTAKQIADGRHREEERRREYYDSLDRKRGGVLQKLWRWDEEFARAVIRVWGCPGTLRFSPRYQMALGGALRLRRVHADGPAGPDSARMGRV